MTELVLDSCFVLDTSYIGWQGWQNDVWRFAGSQSVEAGGPLTQLGTFRLEGHFDD